MPGMASATGLLSARIRPIRRPKPKSVELSGCTRAAPFALRPFAGLFNPYPYGCSVLCNHPADCEAKEVVRRAKDTWVKKFHPPYIEKTDVTLYKIYVKSYVNKSKICSLYQDT
ncbi:uncharacterized protein LOC112456574 [Temnothorax curvispinosus]|uniref:Uncharacterized protein LOC112456574 n=1 Tax=Temnothorax curvispinosus TaxID=300111 RepID=A0A6J1PZX7_9HYME|nr:uncharacterized protein LOC112456574 [Temnothorax curvispinosus]